MSIYQLRIDLNYAKPPIWRRILVKDTTTLAELHEIIQIVMGWDDSHLHQFETGDREYYGIPDEGWDEIRDERKFKLKDIIPAEKHKITYLYDFGDSWDHQILVEKILPVEKGKKYPLCVKGKRACPPEDVGGIGGYYYFLEAISDPKHEAHENYKGWYEGDFDPEEFNMKKINLDLRKFF